MLVYVYDGSFEGLLTAVFEAYYRKEEPYAVLSCSNMQQDLLASYVYIKTDPDKSDRVYASIWQKISNEALENVYYTFLSEDPDAGTLIYRYLKLGWKLGKKVNDFLSDDTVFRILDISRRVQHEVHIMTGFVRFRRVEGDVYYSSISPDFNIIELLAPHFADRLSDQKWIIHDVKREVAALYNMNQWVISDFSADDIPGATEDEKLYSKLWKKFFTTLEIPSRSNPKLQRQLLPRRYWDHLTEKW